mgnify:CR=1 FL=1|tara:strand:- start:7493 stop:8410 length:918 start_codon:yes stop_codon:yes gene_type:complete
MRQLLIGDGTAASYSNNLLAAGSIDIQKLSADGNTSLVPGDTISDSDSIRFVQGTGDKQIASPWIKGKNVVAYGGKAGAAQTAEVGRIALTTNAVAAGQHTLKVINLTDGAEPFNFKSYTITVAAGATPTTQCTAFTTAINADLPYWVNSITNNGTSIDFTCFKKGESLADGSVQSELVHIDFAFEAIDGNGNGTADTVTYQTAGSRGFGDGFYIREFEEELQGSGFGYYNRVELPIQPTLHSVTSNVYDMYHIVASKDGSTTSGINGVDNLIEIYIAIDENDGVAFENQLNGYLASANFAPVIL